MFRTLYSKLSLVLLGLFALCAAVSLLGTLHLFQRYSEESNQRLNQTLAQHLAAQNGLVNSSEANASRLRSMFDMQMITNPSIQIYLLDPDGRIVAFSAKPNEVKLDRVELAPIRAFLDRGANLPIRGDDPRHPQDPRIFSATAIPSSENPQAYLYVMLAAERPAGLWGLLTQSDIAPIAASVAGLSALLALIVGLTIFAFMTRKLERLAGAMDEFQRRDASAHPMVQSAAKERGGDEIDRLTVTFHDMTERMTAQLQRLQQNDTLRRELVANVSHDLKTPIATLQGYVDTLLLKDSALNASERQNYLSIASRSCEPLGKLVNDLIELAKLEAHEVELSPEPFSIGELLQDVAQKFQLKSEQKDVRLVLDFPERLGYVSGDIGLIERVLENLIGNALTHTPPQGSITMQVRVTDEQATISVADTGRGIATGDLPHIFERFYRVHNVDWDKGAHAGLGLAITKSILDLHASRLSVESTLGVGTAFHFTLPLAAVEQAAPRGRLAESRIA
ncbi:MAG: HAMP domain-containing sensor histidine kinase [Betaproteobacteria bacterium]